MSYDAMYKALIMDQPWHFSYDAFQLEVKVHKREERHSVKCDFRSQGNYKEAYESIFRFFNELVWFHGVKVSNISGLHSQGVQVTLNYAVNDDGYVMRFEQKIHEKPQHLALAFYREAVCNESPYYRLLCFSKILEIPFQELSEKIEWIEKQLVNLKGDIAKHFAKRKMATLGDKSLSDWLHQDGRNAVAHAKPGMIIRDPNSYDDWDEVKWANTIMEELAEQVIIQKLNVPRSHGHAQ